MNEIKYKKEVKLRYIHIWHWVYCELTLNLNILGQLNMSGVKSIQSMKTIEEYIECAVIPEFALFFYEPNFNLPTKLSLQIWQKKRGGNERKLCWHVRWSKTHNVPAAPLNVKPGHQNALQPWGLCRNRICIFCLRLFFPSKLLAVFFNWITAIQLPVALPLALLVLIAPNIYTISNIRSATTTLSLGRLIGFG